MFPGYVPNSCAGSATGLVKIVGNRQANLRQQFGRIRLASEE